MKKLMRKVTKKVTRKERNRFKKRKKKTFLTSAVRPRRNHGGTVL